MSFETRIRMAAEKYTVAQADHERQAARMREILTEAQLIYWPDSRILTLKDVYDYWFTPDHEKIEARVETAMLWIRDEATRLTLRTVYYERYVAEYRAQVGQSLAMALQTPVCVFYECGLRDDGEYTYRGCRYGVAAHEYMSGFGRV